MLIDADRHFNISIDQLLPFIEAPWRLEVEHGSVSSILMAGVGDQSVGGRINRPSHAVLGDQSDPVGADMSVVFPKQLLCEGLHPVKDLHVAIAFGYARLLTELYLPAHENVRGMLYLPLDDPEASLDLVTRYGESSKIVGVFTTTSAAPEVHANRLVRLYSEIEERGLVLGFQPTLNWLDDPFNVLASYAGLWAVGVPFTQCVPMINWLLHGMPERFPRLKCVFYETGLAWLSFMAHRLDREFLQRPSEAPILRERPSHYMRRLWYSTHPLEQTCSEPYLQRVVELVGVDRLLYGSNYPEWDFDHPSVIDSLSFLDGGMRARVLGENAEQLFGVRTW